MNMRLKTLGILLLGAVIALGSPYIVRFAWAAVSQNLVVTVQTPKNGTVNFVQGTDSAGTYKTLYTGGANGSKVKALWCSSNDGSASHLLTVQIAKSTTDHCATLGQCLPAVAATVATNAGFANAAGAVNMMSAGVWPGLPIDSDGNPFFYLSGNTQTVEVTFATALTATTQVACTTIAEDF